MYKALYGAFKSIVLFFLEQSDMSSVSTYGVFDGAEQAEGAVGLIFVQSVFCQYVANDMN